MRIFKKKIKVEEEKVIEVLKMMQEGYDFNKITENISKFDKETQEEYLNAYEVIMNEMKGGKDNGKR